MKEVAAFCRQWDMLPAGELVLCAVSGGRDSMALLHLLLELSGREGFSVAAAHYNHHLRPTADRDENFVRDWCRERGVAFYVGGGDAADYAGRHGLSLEDAARRLRYAFLEETADRVGAGRIATAHHLQDNAETVLLHLLRGSGLRGLGGIAPVRGRIVRPLLQTDRAAIDRYVAEHALPYVEDETNADPSFTRNRLRLCVMPLLEEMSPGSAGRIASAAGLLRQEEEHLAGEAQRLLPPRPGDETVIPVTLLNKQDAAMARRLVRLAAHRLGVELTAGQTEAVLRLPSGGCMDLPGGLLAVRKAHRLTLARQAPPPAALELAEGEQSWGEWRVTVGTDGGGALSAALDPRKLTGPLVLAAWDGTGRLSVANGSRTAKRLFADRGIPVEKRRSWPALYSGGRLVALPGVAVDAALVPEGETLLVTLERREKL